MEEYNAVKGNSEFYGPQEPREQADEREKEQNAVFSELPIIQKVIKHLEDAVEFYSKIDSISEEVLTTPADFMHVVMGNKLAVDTLNKEIEALRLLVKEHTES